MGQNLERQLLFVNAESSSPQHYRGRLAPSPTGYLHLGHARTFWTAAQRAQQAGGTLILRSEDLDSSRVRAEFVAAMFEDLRWFGLHWNEGPDIGGPVGSYTQSERIDFYRRALQTLIQRNAVYPCRCTRRDILAAVTAPHLGEEEPIYPGICRPPIGEQPPPITEPRTKISWRFRVPEGESIRFLDGASGAQEFVAGKDFGDFVVWRNDDTPAYQLAVVVDDAAMQITEVVRGADLLLSTARQLLLYRALGLRAPNYFHSPLILDERGQRLAKRYDALSLRRLRELGFSPDAIRSRPDFQ